MVDDWSAFLRGGLSEEDHAAIRSGERSGRPLGGLPFVARLEKRLGRALRTPKRGRPFKKAKGAKK